MSQAGGMTLDRSTTATDAPATFDEFVASRSDALWRTAWLLTGDAHLAEDLLQTALLKTWKKWDRIDHGAAEAYVRRALTTTYTDWWRRKWRGEKPTEEMPESTGDAAYQGRDKVSDVSTRTDVARALAQLTRSQRAIVVLRYFEDLTEQQTADTLGISRGTVKSQTSRALKALRSSPLLAANEEER